MSTILALTFAVVFAVVVVTLARRAGFRRSQRKMLRRHVAVFRDAQARSGQPGLYIASLAAAALRMMPERHAMRATEGMIEHPEGYDGPCLCDSCKSDAN